MALAVGAMAVKVGAARPAAVGTALAHSASMCAAARPSAVAFTTQRMKEPGQNTEASICQVKVSSATMAPRLVFWDSSVEAMTERDEGERRQRSNTEISYEGAGRGDASVEEAVRIAREGVCQGGVPRGLTALGRQRKKKRRSYSIRKLNLLRRKEIKTRSISREMIRIMQSPVKNN